MIERLLIAIGLIACVFVPLLVSGALWLLVRNVPSDTWNQYG